MHACLVEAVWKKTKKNCSKYSALSLWDINFSIGREWNNNTVLCLTDGLLGKYKRYQLDSVLTWI